MKAFFKISCLFSKSTYVLLNYIPHSLVQSKAFEISLKKQITDKCVSTFQNDDTNDDTTTGTRRTMLRFCRLKERPTVAVGPQSENQHSALSYVCEKVFTY